MIIPNALRTTLFVFSLTLFTTTDINAQPANSVFPSSVGTVRTVSISDPDNFEASASLSGRVVNDTGSGKVTDGVAGVRVVLRPANGGQRFVIQHRISDRAGKFYFTGVRPDKYLIQVDPISLPARFRTRDDSDRTIDVQHRETTIVDLPIVAKRTVSGTVFIDKDRNGQYRPGKDVPVKGALITIGGVMTESRADGSYTFHDLPAGRIAMLIQWPGSDERTHVIFYLADGPVMNRGVNIPKGH